MSILKQKRGTSAKDPPGGIASPSFIYGLWWKHFTISCVLSEGFTLTVHLKALNSESGDVRKGVSPRDDAHHPPFPSSPPFPPPPPPCPRRFPLPMPGLPVAAAGLGMTPPLAPPRRKLALRVHFIPLLIPSILRISCQCAKRFTLKPSRLALKPHNNLT